MLIYNLVIGYLVLGFFLSIAVFIFEERFYRIVPILTSALYVVTWPIFILLGIIKAYKR